MITLALLILIYAIIRHRINTNKQRTLTIRTRRIALYRQWADEQNAMWYDDPDTDYKEMIRERLRLK